MLDGWGNTKGHIMYPSKIVASANGLVVLFRVVRSGEEKPPRLTVVDTYRADPWARADEPTIRRARESAAQYLR